MTVVVAGVITAVAGALDADAARPDHQRARTALHRDLAALDGARDATDGGPRAPTASLSALVTARLAADPDPRKAVMAALNTADVDRRPDAELHSELRARFLTRGRSPT